MTLPSPANTQLDCKVPLGRSARVSATGVQRQWRGERQSLEEKQGNLRGFLASYHQISFFTFLLFISGVN